MLLCSSQNVNTQQHSSEGMYTVMTSSNISANRIKPARVQPIDEGRGTESYQQLDLPFDVPESYHQPELPFVGGIECHGGLRPDPSGRVIVDRRPRLRHGSRTPTCGWLAAASRMNWDLRVQLQLAQDDDERVVLALLDHVDPYVETCDVIINGPTSRRGAS